MASKSDVTIALGPVVTQDAFDRRVRDLANGFLVDRLGTDDTMVLPHADVVDVLTEARRRAIKNSASLRVSRPWLPILLTKEIQ
jgi:hypothetical protein